MGCDGGTIPTRDELVRLKKKPEKKDKDAELDAKWKRCALTQEPLQKPIVACQLGRLYNKDAILELLIDRSKFESVNNVDHIRGLKDIKELVLSDNPGYNKPATDKGDQYIDRSTAKFYCPLSGLEMSGKYRFIYLSKCGCVFSERGLNAIKTESCSKCGTPFCKSEVIILNGTDEEVEELEKKMEERKLQAKLAKKAKRKNKAEALGKFPEKTEGIASDGASSSKVAKLSGMPSTSKTKLANDLKADKKATNGKMEEKKITGIQKDPKSSEVYKSLFTSHSSAKNQESAHWVTHNPLYY